MQRLFLVVVVQALLVTFGFAQTPDAGNKTDLASLKGCLGGSDGNYTVAEDGTVQIFKVTTSGVDLKPHLGHDVSLTGHRTTKEPSSGAADNSFAVTELHMIAEHCAPAATTAAAAAVVTAIPPPETIAPVPDTAAPAATASTPAVDTAAPGATATASTPAVDTAAPGATATAGTPAVDSAAPGATVTASTPVVDTAPARDAAHRTRPSAPPRKTLTTQAAAPTSPRAERVSPSSDTVIPVAGDTVTPAAGTASPSSDAVSTPAPDATTPVATTPVATIPAVTHRGISLWLLVSLVVLVIVLGTLFPLIGRWRKRKMLERTDTPNLSLTNETMTAETISSSEKREPRKIA